MLYLISSVVLASSTILVVYTVRGLARLSRATAESYRVGERIIIEKIEGCRPSKMTAADL